MYVWIDEKGIFKILRTLLMLLECFILFNGIIVIVMQGAKVFRKWTQVLILVMLVSNPSIYTTLKDANST